MTKIKSDSAHETFANRARAYDQETNWVSSEDLLLPLIPRTPSSSAFRTANFLDVCSGTGQVARRAAKEGWNPIALDQSEEMLQKLSNDDILCVIGNAESLPFVKNSFEVVAMRQALHYFDTGKMLKELGRVSKNEIRLGHITTHDAEDIPIWKEYFEVASPGRLSVFSPNEVPDTARAVGLEVVDVSTSYSVENFFGPIQHLQEEIQKDLLEKFLLGRRRSVARYFDLERLDRITPKMKLRWEFVTIRAKVSDSSRG